MAKMCFSFVCALLVALPRGTYSVKALPPFIPGDGDLLFNPYDMMDNEFVVEMPAGCNGKSFCFEKGDNYPEEKIEALLEDMRTLTLETPDRTSIGDRQGGGDMPDCPSNSTENPIYYITDENDRVRVVVQSKTKFQQIYTVSMCLNEGKIERDTPHFLKSSRILKNYKVECVSTKLDFDFFVLSNEVDYYTSKPKMEIARAKGGIPVCCKCRYMLKTNDAAENRE